MSSDRPPETMEKVREQLREATVELESIRSRLLELHSTLPATPPEGAPLMEAETLDILSNLRNAIGCALEDRIAPALRLLRKTVGEPPSPPIF